MLDFPRSKVIGLWLILIVCVLLSVPSMVPSSTLASLPSSIPMPRINLGLDLAGGSHLLLEADASQVRQTEVERLEDEVRTAMRRASPRIAIGDVSRAGDRLSFTVADPGQIDAAREQVQNLTSGVGLTGQRNWTVDILDGNRIVLTPTEAGISSKVDTAMNSATDVIRRRIDAVGTREPTIIRQGSNRIVVQVPGLSDPQKLKDLLGKTAKLEFKLVDLNADPTEVQAGRAPIGSQVLPFSEDAARRIAVRRLGGIAGDQLSNAQASVDQQTNQPTVVITFNSAGGQKFARLTQANVGKPFAIILDGKVLSAPNINEPILGGTASISGSFTTDSAAQLAIALNSGALPVDLKVVEQRTVGPDLGADSIRKGMIAGIVGTGAVLAFMLVTYGRFGVYACGALILNVLMILGVMALIGATLTLPGIAGFVLTIGAAVDANVLINERIREERHRGRKIVQAIELGYSEASRAIFDANITNVIAAVLLYAFGSGPIKGFAVVLTIGIVTSVFTAVTITRMWVSQWVRAKRPTELAL